MRACRAALVACVATQSCVPRLSRAVLVASLYTFWCNPDRGCVPVGLSSSPASRPSRACLAFPEPYLSHHCIHSGATPTAGMRPLPATRLQHKLDIFATFERYNVCQVSKMLQPCCIIEARRTCPQIGSTCRYVCDELANRYVRGSISAYCGDIPIFGR